MIETSTARTQVFRAISRNHDAVRLVTAYALFSVCEFAVYIAVLVYAYGHGGATAAGLVAVAQLVPAAVVALLVAPLADRRSPVSVLLGGYVVQGLGAGGTAALLFAEAPPLAVYAGAVVTTAAMATTRPSQSALLPGLAREVDQLTACNVVLGWVENVSILIAGVVTGLALTFGGVGDVFGGAAVLLVAAALTVSPLRRLALGRTSSDADAPSAEPALLGVWRDPPVRLLVGLLGAEFTVVGALDLLFVVLAVDVLDAGRAWTGYLNTAYGAGSLVFGMAAALLVGRRLGPVALGAAALLGTALALCAVAGVLGVVLLLALVGGSRTLFDVTLRVLLQRSTSPDRIAGVFGVVEGAAMLGLSAGALLVPALVALGGAPLAILGTAALLPGLAVLRSRRLMRIDEHARVPVVEMALLRQVPLLAPLPRTAMEGLAQSVERVQFDAGEALVREGEIGDAYYALADGTVEVSQRGQPIRRLGRAEGLGEIALLRSVPRTATAVALTPVTAYRLARGPFLTAVTGHAPTWESADRVVRAHEAGDADRHRTTFDPPSSSD